MKDEWLEAVKLAGKFTAAGLLLLAVGVILLGALIGATELLHHFQRTMGPG